MKYLAQPWLKTALPLLLALLLPSGAHALIASIEAAPSTETTLSYEVRLDNASEPLTTTIATRYRPAGSTTWFDAAPAIRIRPDWTLTSLARSPGFAGMIFFLQPNTTYEVEVTLTRGSTVDTQVQTLSTRRKPRQDPLSPNSVNVSSDAQLSSAISNASPGDVIVLAPGNYSADLDLRASGTYDNPIVLRGASRDGTVLSVDSSQFGSNTFEVHGDHWTIENLTLRNTNGSGYALRARAASNLTVRGCRLIGNGGIDGRHSQSGANADWSIYDNVVERGLSWADILGALDAGDTSTLWGGEGLADIQGSGHEIYQNTLSGFGDTLGVSNPFQFTIDGTLAQMNRGIAIRNNHVLYGGDDGVEMDDAYSHVAAYQNLIVNTANMYSAQPNVPHGGPRYFFQNIGINQHGGSTGSGGGDAIYKIKTSVNGQATVQPGIIVNNTTYSSTLTDNDWGHVQSGAGGDAVSNMWFLNNVLYLTQPRTTGLFFNESGGTWRWYDYNAMGAASGPKLFSHGDFSTESDVLAFAARGYTDTAPFDVSRGVDTHSIEVGAADLDVSQVSMPSTYRSLATGGDIVPSAGSALIGTGIPIPQLSQDGGADIGARTRGSPAPRYGASMTPPSPGDTPNPPVLLD